MPEQLLNILKICLLALVYLFFFRVLRAVWAEITPPKTTGAGRGRAGGAPPVALVEPAPSGRRAAAGAPDGARGRRGRREQGPARLTFVEPADLRGRGVPLGALVTIGRAPNCELPLEDTFVSQVHARVFERDGSYVVEDLGSTNGTYLNRNRVSGAMIMHRGDRLQVGNTVLELV